VLVRLQPFKSVLLLVLFRSHYVYSRPNSTTSFTDRSTRPQYVLISSSVRSDRDCAHVLVRLIKTRHVSASPYFSLTLQTSNKYPSMPPSMPPRKNISKRKNAATPPTQTEEQAVVVKPSTENDAPPQNPPSDDSKSEGQMSVIHVTYVTII